LAAAKTPWRSGKTSSTTNRSKKTPPTTLSLLARAERAGKSHLPVGGISMEVVAELGRANSHRWRKRKQFDLVLR
jgi:hypothetical protein